MTAETTVWLDERYMITITPFGISDPGDKIKRDGIENYQGSGLAIQSVEVEGPIVEEFPTTNSSELRPAGI